MGADHRLGGPQHGGGWYCYFCYHHQPWHGQGHIHDDHDDDHYDDADDNVQVMERSLELAIWDHDRIGKTQDFLGGARFDIF